MEAAIDLDSAAVGSSLFPFDFPRSVQVLTWAAVALLQSGAAEWGERWAGRNNAASARPLAVGRLMRTDPSTDLGIDF